MCACVCVCMSVCLCVRITRDCQVQGLNSVSQWTWGGMGGEALLTVEQRKLNFNKPLQLNNAGGLLLQRERPWTLLPRGLPSQHAFTSMEVRRHSFVIRTSLFQSVHRDNYFSADCETHSFILHLRGLSLWSAVRGCSAIKSSRSTSSQ